MKRASEISRSNRPGLSSPLQSTGESEDELHIQRWSNYFKEFIPFVHITIRLNVIGKDVSLVEVTSAFSQFTLEEKQLRKVLTVLLRLYLFKNNGIRLALFASYASKR